LTSGRGRPWRRAEREERLLEIAAGAVGAGFVLRERAAEPRGPSVLGMGSGQGIEGGVVGELLDLRLVERVRELAVGGDGGVVEDRASGPRERDATPGDHLHARQSGMPVDVEPGMRAGTAVCDDDIDEGRLPSSQRPLERGRPVAQRSARSAGEHGGGPAPGL
jgi:hypothetical protein